MILLNFLFKGHSVDILTGYPNYPEGKIFKNYKENPNKFKTYFGANIIRIPVRLRRKSTKLDLFKLSNIYIVLNRIWRF